MVGQRAFWPAEKVSPSKRLSTFCVLGDKESALNCGPSSWALGPDMTEWQGLQDEGDPTSHQAQEQILALL